MSKGCDGVLVRGQPFSSVMRACWPWLCCRFRGVSKKKGRWEAKVMLNRKWAYRWVGAPSGALQLVGYCLYTLSV